jgi:hypothetical protein
MEPTSGIRIQREILLVEIDRRCFFGDCNGRILIGLTKTEAASYIGFECTHCKRWNDDRLVRTDIPEWWDDLNNSDLNEQASFN